ncbi:thioredoxin domain-containing protein [Virgibacillus soli]|uniref:Thioredoxin domain-containing protein n=1 Tax=Paracerasibacillus soli TaxID=480284 RepID=A0ABU5CT35_9BACI|nr:thioredoxin domain-containing protein [Virgibacillus soli]MDY0409002.1 thioredoxin domain-containing protein [Virgibacillus soli]
MATIKNKLINEKSPYLLQHAYNPVDWFPWGEEAFAKAKQENKPIFLSIGYSTCHWCHVMAHESFEDEEIANILNEHYVAIKVDREERPDIDSIYMKICQMMAGHGGWPLTIFMTPDKVPFYAGTYFPKESRHGMPGLVEALVKLHKKYVEDPDHISEVTDSVRDALEHTVEEKSNIRLSKDTTVQASEQLRRMFDMKNGGFGGAPKFPQPQNLLFLLQDYQFNNNEASLKMVEHTLQKMARGGIYDHIGFGFARYATDKKWLVPHFEKMLYDNALLLTVYTNCYQVTQNPYYQQISEEIMTFIIREMMGPDGAFYSAIDADSEGVEGKYYVWDDEEIFDLLGEDLGALYADTYGITPHGNFEGKNIPNLIHVDLTSIAKAHSMTIDVVKQKLETARGTLLTAREKRVYPHVDDKILTSWNALMIVGFASAGRIFGNNSYIETAEKAMKFIEEKLFVDNRLMARYRHGEAKFKGYLDDYAFLLWAYVELYQATFSTAYLEKARKLTDQMIALFWDKKNGGFFFSGKDSEQLISSDKEVYDGALPSGNSVAAVMLTKLSYLTGAASYLELTDEMFYTFFHDVNRQASAASFFVQSLFLAEYPTKEVVVIGSKNDPEYQRILQIIGKHYLPNVTVLAANQDNNLSKVAPFVADYQQIGDQTTIYICENFSCQQPTTDVNLALKQLGIMTD